MKKFICLILAALTTLAFTGCSCSGSSSSVSPEGSYWLNNSNVIEVPTGFTESAEYSLSVKNTGDIKLTIESGAYGYTLKSVTLPEDTTNTLYYELTTSFTLKGSYNYKNTDYPVDDAISSTVIFKGVNEKLKPTSSVKTIKCTSPVLNENGKFEFKNYDFGYVIDYTAGSGKHAVVTYTDNTADKNANLPEQKEFKKYFSSAFCENELLMLYPRTFKRSSSFGTTVTVLNASNQTKEKIKLSIGSFEAKVTDTLWGEILVDTVNFTKTGTYAGIPITAYYASNQGKKLDNGNRVNQSRLKHAMVKMQTGIAGVGTLTYTLTSFNNSQNA